MYLFFVPICAGTLLFLHLSLSFFLDMFNSSPLAYFFFFTLGGSSLYFDCYNIQLGGSLCMF